MSRGAATHVIEIEAGAGQPARIPLTLGAELEPLAIGRTGSWRLDADGVRDVHAFVYFDGAALFLRADDGAVATVDGVAVATTWTEIHAPCTIAIGAARLRYRSAADHRTAREAPRPLAPPAVTPTSSGRSLPSSRRSEEPSRRSRPFRPGELSNAPAESESTRVAPVEASSARAPQAPDAAWPQRAATLPRTQRTSSVAEPFVPAAPGTRPRQPPTDLRGGVPRDTSSVPGTLMLPDVPPGVPDAPPPYPSGYPLPPSAAQRTGGYGPIAAAPPPSASLLARFKELTPPQRLLLLIAPFSLLSAAYLVLFDDASEPPRAIADAGVEAAAIVATAPPTAVTTPATSAPPPEVACPPGFVLYDVPIHGQLSCIPAPDAGGVDPSRTTVPTTPPPTTTARTLERQAVDLVATGNYAAAAQTYEVLLQQSPTNRVYAEAARILRAKADAGIP
jgi:hypothetical protein